MSIQIYQDAENLVAGNGKKTRREDSRITRQNVPKPNKRAALGNITNVQQRVQPSRAAKDKHKVTSTKISTKDAFKIHQDVPKSTQNDALHAFQEALSIQKDSPMVLSPIASSASESFEEIRTDEVARVLDIDLHTDYALGCPEYAQDIHNYLKKAEKKIRAKPHYMNKQADINGSMRSILVDWLVEVAEEYKLVPQTLYLTINYIDRFLSCMSVQRGKLQLVGASCMLVASKFEEIYPPEVSEFVYITDDTYTAKQVLRMEHLILKTLSFDVSVPTCRDFLSRYLLAAGGKEESQLQYLSQYLCELTLVDCHITMNYTPSQITASAVCIANHVIGNTPWSATLEFYSGYQASDIMECVNEMFTLYKNAPDHPQQAVFTKYKAPKFGCVSSISVPQSPPFMN